MWVLYGSETSIIVLHLIVTSDDIKCGDQAIISIRNEKTKFNTINALREKMYRCDDMSVSSKSAVVWCI